MSEQLPCWKCGASLEDLLFPLSRLAECPACRAELHVCRFCRFFDPSAAQGCREPVAEDVRDKERANFCGYFQPGGRAWRGASGEASAGTRAELDSLFGGRGEGSPSFSSSAARDNLEALFKK